jgi:hypothetical protein
MGARNCNITQIFQVAFTSFSMSTNQPQLQIIKETSSDNPVTRNEKREEENREEVVSLPV